MNRYTTVFCFRRTDDGRVLTEGAHNDATEERTGGGAQGGGKSAYANKDTNYEYE